MLRFHGVVVAASVIAAALSVTSALADSRIFTVKASEPGVTIEQAFRNGKELAVSGRGDGTTLFRIDEPSTIVACANRFDFVTSTGEKVNLAADMCVLNWEVTVDVAAAPAPPPPAATAEPTPPAATPPAAAAEPTPPASTPPPAATAAAPDLPAIPDIPDVPGDTAPPAATTTPVPPGGSFSQVVTVSADDPTVTITGLTLDGAPAAITGGGQGKVQFEIQGSEQGIVCQRDLGITLSDGRQVTKNANLCLNDWHVVVAVSGAAPPAPGAPAPTSPPPSAGMAWTFTAGEIAATLVNGIPETDATAFVASCNRGSDRVTVTLYEAGIPGLAPGAAIPVTFFAGGFTKTYQGKMTAVDEMSGSSHPEVVISAGDPLWSALIHESNLGIAAGPAYSATLSLKGSAAPTRQLLAACLGQPAPPTSPPPAVATGGGGGGGGITARYGCEIGPGFTVTYFGDQQSATLVEAGAPPLSLRWTPEGQLGRYIAGDARLTLREDHVRWSRFGEKPRSCFPQ